jgi:hypothetical protein
MLKSGVSLGKSMNSVAQISSVDVHKVENAEAYEPKNYESEPELGAFAEINDSENKAM